MNHSYCNLRAYYLASSRCQAYARNRVDSFDEIDFLSWNQRYFLRRIVVGFIHELYGSVYNVRFAREKTVLGHSYFICHMTDHGWGSWHFISSTSTVKI
jgi:hypothetical protein